MSFISLDRLQNVEKMELSFKIIKTETSYSKLLKSGSFLPGKNLLS